MAEYGHFSNKTYIITERNIPRNWYNYMHNEEFISFVSQVGYGCGIAQDNMGRRVTPVTDRNIFISDGKTFWQATGLPVYDPAPEYRCEHHIGYTEITLSKNGITSQLRFFVPPFGRREIIRVTVENISTEQKELRVIPYIETAIDGLYTPQGYQITSAKFYENKNAVAGVGYSSIDGIQGKKYAYLTSDKAVSSFDTRHTAFIGTYGNKQMPRALMENLGCFGTECVAEKICLALENTVKLKPQECAVFYYTVGIAANIEDIPQFTATEIESQFYEMASNFSTICSGVEIKTPWNHLNHLFNDWLKYQTVMGSQWARVRHNGIRDLTSDTECLSCFQAPLAAERLCRIMQYQYANGYAPRTFLDGAIKDNNFSDNMVWMVFAVHSITKELGDTGFLLRQVPFNDNSTATIYEHIRRAVEFLWGFTGHHGLIRIWCGDWNDCMNKVGHKGEGVSIWLSIAFVRAAKILSEIASWLKNDDDVKTYSRYATIMEERINQFGWNGDRYLYAISDDGLPVGGAECEEGSLFALPQLWSVLADLDPGKALTAMDTLEKELNTDLGLLISKPPYTKPWPYIGAITKKHPGLHENGGVYLHASVWKLAVDSILGHSDKIEEGLRKILPSDHTYFQTCGEPYVMFNSYLGLETGYRAGTPGQSWRTATGQWLLYALVKYIFGLYADFDGLRICPCLPPSWKECSITKKFRSCTYNIFYRGNGKVTSITVNGQNHDISTPIPPTPNGTLDIEVVLK